MIALTQRSLATYGQRDPNPYECLRGLAVKGFRGTGTCTGKSSTEAVDTLQMAAHMGSKYLEQKIWEYRPRFKYWPRVIPLNSGLDLLSTWGYNPTSQCWSVIAAPPASSADEVYGYRTDNKKLRK